MSERKTTAARTMTLKHEVFVKDPAAALKRAEQGGSVVIKHKDGSVHSVISVPRDRRPIALK